MVFVVGVDFIWCYLYGVDDVVVQCVVWVLGVKFVSKCYLYIGDWIFLWWLELCYVVVQEGGWYKVVCGFFYCFVCDGVDQVFVWVEMVGRLVQM